MMRGLAIAALLMMALASACQHVPAERAQGPAWSLALHGGAGVIERASMTSDQEADYRAALAAAAAHGGDMLARGVSAIDVVEAVARLMEDDPRFNAGRGAVFTAEGRNELDASIMNGATLEAGAVAGLTATRNPISAARAVMDRSPHVMLSGPGADAFAASLGLDQVGPDYFFTEHRWAALERALRAQGATPPPRPAWAPAPDGAPQSPAADEPSRGTIGVVARDQDGDMAAATSTGGLSGKRWGRVGDAPIIGAGVYAQNGVCAISATGAGEYFIRLAIARSICALIEFTNASAQSAADALIQERLAALGGTGGVIVLGPDGEAAFSLNTPGMYRASFAAGEDAPTVAIFADE
jgi:beta-aspartyl-peptidase (threonine type)